MMKRKKLYKFIAFLLVQTFLLVDCCLLSNIAYSRPDKLSPSLQISKPDFKNSIQILEDRNKLLEILDRIPLLELTIKDIPSSLYNKFRKIKENTGEQGGDAVSFMLKFLGFGERINLWRKTDHEKAVRVMKETIMPFLQKNCFVSKEVGFQPVALVDDEAAGGEYTLEQLIGQGDLYYTRFLDTDFSDAVYEILSIKTSGLAGTVAGNALKFGKIVEEATEGRIKAEQVVRAYYRRELLPKLEEIYKYSNYLYSLYKQKRQIERLDNIVSFYEDNKDMESFSIDEELIADINSVHRYLTSKLPNANFLTYVKDILSLRNWLKETGFLSSEEVELLENYLDGFWPEEKGDSTLIKTMLESHSAWIEGFHEKNVKPVLDFLNVRLWRWKGRRLKHEKDYLRLLQRSPGWFSALGIADWLKKENYAIKDGVDGPVRILSLDAFFSGAHRAIIKKEGKIPEDVQIIDLVTDKLGKRFGKNPRKVNISANNYWPFQPENADFITSIFNLHQLKYAELFSVFQQASHALKPGGSFIITVPFDRYIPPEGISVLSTMGFKVKFESVSYQEIKNPAKLSENREIISESISRRKFYLLVLEKQKPAEKQELVELADVDKKHLRFIEAPISDNADRIEKRIRPKKSLDINFKNAQGRIEDIEADNLMLRALYNRLPVGRDMNEDKFWVMFKNIFDYKLVLYEYFIELNMNDNFDILDKLIDDLKDIIGREEFSLKDLTISDQETIPKFHTYLESIFIVLKTTPNFSKTLKNVIAFRRNNSNFLEPEDIALIKNAEEIWNTQIIQGKNIDFEKIQEMFNEMIEMQRKISGIETELAALLQRWGADEKIKDELKGKSFWPVIKSLAGWKALQYFCTKHSKRLKTTSEIYMCNTNALLEKIVEKVMNEANLKTRIKEFPRNEEQIAKLQNSAYYVLSMFDYADIEDESLVEPPLLNIRTILRKNGRFIIILPKMQDSNGFRQSLRDSGFNILTTYRNTGFNLIETDIGGKTEELLSQLNNLKRKSSLNELDKEILRQLWASIFKKMGTSLTDDLKRALQTYINTLPIEENFRIMLEQLREKLKTEDVTKQDFVPLLGMERFLDTLLSKFPDFKCSLYDRITNDERLLEGLLMHTTKEGIRANWLLEFEEDRFFGYILQLKEKLEKFQPTNEGVVKGLETNNKNHIKSLLYSTEVSFRVSQYLEQANRFHQKILEDIADIKKIRKEIDAKIETLFFCEEEELPLKYTDINNYFWHGDTLLKLTVFSLIIDTWESRIEYDAELKKRAKLFEKFMNERKQVDWKTMDHNIAEAMRLLFLLSSWVQNTEDEQLLNLLIRQKIDKLTKLTHKDIADDINITLLLLELPHTKNIDRKRIAFDLLTDNENDKLFFKNRLVKMFYFSNHVLNFELVYTFQSIINFSKHDRAVYLELLGRIIGHFRQRTDSLWRKKMMITDKIINIFILDKNERAILAKGESNPLSQEEATTEIDKEEDILVTIAEIEQLPAGSSFDVSFQLQDMIKMVNQESSLVAVNLLATMINLLDREVNLKDRLEKENRIKKVINNVRSNFVLATLMLYNTKRTPLIRAHIARHIIPDKDFTSLSKILYYSDDCIALLIEENPAVRKAILRLVNSDDSQEMVPAMRMIRRYLIHRQEKASSEFLVRVWTSFLEKHGLVFGKDAELKFNSLLRDLPKKALIKSTNILINVGEKLKDKYPADELDNVVNNAKDILARIELEYLSDSDVLAAEDLSEPKLTKEAAFINRSI